LFGILHFREKNKEQRIRNVKLGSGRREVGSWKHEVGSPKTPVFK